MADDIWLWRPSLRWDTPAGQTLQRLVDVLPPKSHPLITVFGSAPIQMGIEPKLLSADVDVFSDLNLTDIVEANGLGREQSNTYIQVCDELNFRTSPKWAGRAFVLDRGSCKLRFPHPLDILIAKMLRGADKDLEAFQAVIQKTGHPTETELISELQDAVDLFRPGFHEEKASDMITTTSVLWRHIFGRDINPRVEIIAPALERRRKGYGEPTTDLKKELRNVVKRPTKGRQRANSAKNMSGK